MKPFFLSLLLFFLSDFVAQSQNLENIVKEKPLAFSSNISLQTQYYTVSGIEPRQPGFSYFLSGSPTLSVYGFAIPLSFVLSNQQFAFQQPFNQFGLTPQYKWVKVHAGYSSVQFSPFTVNGLRFLGGGLELNPGKLRLGFMYGRLRRAVPENLSVQPNPENFLYEVPSPSYQRTGYAAKLGVGTANNYFDFIYFRGKDNVTSITPPTQGGVTPQSNGIVGISTQFTLFKKLQWKTDLGLSLFTRNMLSDSLALDSVVSPWVKNLAGTLIDLNNSTYFALAGETSLNWQDKNYSLKLQYRRVEPDYQSMGAYYFQQDVEQYTFAPSFIFNQGKMVVSGSIGTQKDNLKKLKVFTADRLIGSANVAYNPSAAFGININYANFGFTQNPITTSISDSSAIRQVSHNLTISPRFMKANETFIHVISPTFTYGKLADLTRAVLFKSDMTSKSVVLSYNLNWQPKQIDFGLSLLYLDVLIDAGKTSNLGADFNVNKNFMQGKAQANAGVSFYKNGFNGNDNGSTFKLNAQVNWALFTKHRMFISGNYIKNTSLDALAGRSFTEFYGQSGINLSF